VHDAALVGEGHGLAHLQDDRERPYAVPAVGPVADLREDVREVLAAHEAHGEEEATSLVEPQLVHGNDAGMVELARDLRFLEEAVDRRRIGGARRPDLPHHLHGGLSPQVEIPRAEHLPHAPAAHGVANPVSLARPPPRPHLVDQLARAAGRVVGRRSLERET
jgi:hypothetical protein